MERYIRLINKTEDYIEANLDRQVTLKELAENMYMSEYHFHRLFKQYSKETIKQFITRVKMERSAIFLLVNPKITITEIAYRYGYCDASSYCKSFKRHFQVSPAEFRKNSRKLFRQLFAFAEANHLVIPDTTKVLTIYNDNPFITDGKNLRTSVAMTIPADVQVQEDGEVCLGTISGRFGVGHFEISAREYGEAWQYMYQEWLFAGKYKARDSVPFELYVTEPPKNIKDRSYTDIYIPIEE